MFGGETEPSGYEASRQDGTSLAAAPVMTRLIRDNYAPSKRGLEKFIETPPDEMELVSQYFVSCTIVYLM